jgi:transposase
MKQAVDEVCRAESTRLRATSREEGRQLKNLRWRLLRKGSRVRGRARKKFNTLLANKLATTRGWRLTESFHHFWTYKSPTWSGGFLEAWCIQALHSRLEPMKKVARML